MYINNLYLIPLIRTSRAITACTLIPTHPILAIGVSEIYSYTIPFIYNSPINSLNDMILFIFYFFNYYDSSLDIMNKYVHNINYKIEINIINNLYF